MKQAIGTEQKVELQITQENANCDEPADHAFRSRKYPCLLDQKNLAHLIGGRRPTVKIVDAEIFILKRWIWKSSIHRFC